MKRACVVILLVVVSFALCGYSAPKKKAQPPPHVYFTIHHHGQRIAVSDATLKPKWHNQQSHADFTRGKGVYERAVTAKSIQKDFPEIFQMVKRIEREVEVAAFDGNIHFDTNREDRFWVTDAKDGLEMDVAGALRDIMNALKSKTHADIIIKTRVVAHKTESRVLAKIGMRAQYSTRFDAGNHGRSENIERSAQCFNGLVVPVGEEISFNKTVGPRTAERGYEEAKIIIDGEFVPGIGGGVCQTSTTLFNAGLLAGLSVAESHNHSLPITYVPLGRDAMVSSAVDLRLVNKTGGTVYIESGIEKNNRVFFKIYGDKLGDVKYKPTTEVSEKPQEIEVVGTTPRDLSLYEKRVVDEGYPARSARTYLETWDDGKIINKKLIRKSNYKGKTEVIRYELLPPPPPEPVTADAPTLLDMFGSWLAG
jgi:vancomycin resistance protein YoaR